MKTLILIAGVIVCATGLWFMGVATLTRPSIQVEWIEGLYEKKEAAARGLGPGKIVLVGGSSVHYGYSGVQLTHLTGVPSVNLGVHAGLGMEYLLDRAEKSLQRGDVAVLAIEPALYFSAAPSNVLSEYILRYDRGFLLRVGPETAVRVVFGTSLPDVIKTEYQRFVPWRSPLARSESVSAAGDERTLGVSKLTFPGTRAKLLAQPPMPALASSPDSPPAALRSFFQWARAHEVTVMQAWSPMLENTAYSSEPYLTFYSNIAQWFRREGAIGLNDPRAFFLPIDEMFDYVLHANEHGKQTATIALSRWICSVMVCPRMTALHDHPSGK